MMANIQCDISLATNYSGATQKARVISEGWVEANGYCLACDGDQLTPTRRNTRARDFVCKDCSHPYELKSTAGRFGKRVLDGAYSTMIKRVKESTTPTFLLMEYTPSWSINSLFAIHHLLITPSSIERRKPLAATAQRAGWVGCNISLSNIPPEGRIPVIQDGYLISRSQTRANFALVDRLAHISVAERNWTSTILLLLHTLERREFTLKDAYGFEADLKRRYPANHHVREKIRQQLQVLRNSGILIFKSRGHYSFAI